MQQVFNEDIDTCPTKPLLHRRHRRHHHRTGADSLRCPRWTDLENRLQIAAWPPIFEDHSERIWCDSRCLDQLLVEPENAHISIFRAHKGETRQIQLMVFSSVFFTLTPACQTSEEAFFGLLG